jgi:hypothetical protein
LLFVDENSRDFRVTEGLGALILPTYKPDAIPQDEPF